VVGELIQDDVRGVATRCAGVCRDRYHARSVCKYDFRYLEQRLAKHAIFGVTFNGQLERRRPFLALGHPFKGLPFAAGEAHPFGAGISKSVTRRFARGLKTFASLSGLDTDLEPGLVS